VKLLLDENLSRKLVPALQRSTDADPCDHADKHGFVVCSKDEDFQQLVASRRYRPKLVRITLGNAGNEQVYQPYYRWLIN